MQEFIDQILTPDHWPWVAVMVILTIIVQVADTRIFTRDRAYKKRSGKIGYIIKSLFYWGRELLPIFPIMTGVVIGILWPDPEGTGLNLMASIVYFGSAGAVSDVAWKWLKGRAKKKGYDLRLPGSSEPPKADK